MQRGGKLQSGPVDAGGSHSGVHAGVVGASVQRQL
jgi:hypothetical protein